MKFLVLSIALSSISLSVNASVNKNHSYRESQIPAVTKSSVLFLIDDDTNEACVVRSSNLNIGSANECSEQDKVLATELSSLPQNPQLAGIGAVAVAVLDYYLLCSFIQFSPDIFDSITSAMDSRATFEKIKDTFSPSEEKKYLNSTSKAIHGFSNIVTATLCLPVGVANKKLVQIYKSN